MDSLSKHLRVPYMCVTGATFQKALPSASRLLSPAQQQKLWVPGTLTTIWKFGQKGRIIHMVTVWFPELVEIIEGYLSLCPFPYYTNSSNSPSPDILHILHSGSYVRVFGENTAENSPSEG